MPFRAFSSLWNWLRRWDSPRRKHLHVVLYTRRGCHLCEEAWEILQMEQKRFRFALEAVDVDDSPELAARYGEEVPVVTVDGKIRFRGGVNRVLLTRLLRGEGGRKHEDGG